MQKSRQIGMFAASVFALFPAVTKDSKPEDGKELTKGQKIKNNIRKFSPLLAVGSMLPMLAEEAKASIRGCKWAKEMLNPSTYSKILKTNVIAYSSYVISALSFGAFAIAAKKIKDNSQIKFEQKQAREINPDNEE